MRIVSNVNDPFGNVPAVGIVTKSNGGNGCSLCEKMVEHAKSISDIFFIS